MIHSFFFLQCPVLSPINVSSFFFCCFFSSASQRMVHQSIFLRYRIQNGLFLRYRVRIACFSATVFTLVFFRYRIHNVIYIFLRYRIHMAYLCVCSCGLNMLCFIHLCKAIKGIKAKI